MVVSALLSVSPANENSMAEGVAQALEALEEFDVEYETNPMCTVLEADSVAELFDAVEAAHEAVEGERVVTFLKIDDKRGFDGPAEEKVRSVEKVLGREARSSRSGNETE
ncbi:MAG: thiamine-binding protein [Halobacteria archaeon]|nr:thiamine-binding protein [Halobacteria archaeon]